MPRQKPGNKCYQKVNLIFVHRDESSHTAHRLRFISKMVGSDSYILSSSHASGSFLFGGSLTGLFLTTASGTFAAPHGAWCGGAGVGCCGRDYVTKDHTGRARMRQEALKLALK